MKGNLNMKGNLKKYVGIGIGVACVIALGFIMPTPEGMTADAQKVFALTACLVCLWVFGSFPIGVSSLFALLLLPLLGIMPLDGALQQFMRPATFFLVTTYAISVSFAKTPLGLRLLKTITRLSGFKSDKVILAIMITTCLLSTLVSNVPVTAMMSAVTLQILRSIDAVPGKSRLGRTLMIAISIAATCGGFMTPVGSSNNVLAINLSHEIIGTDVSFFKWMSIGVPLGAALLFGSWFFLVKFFGPEEIPDLDARMLASVADVPARITSREWKALVIIGVTVAMWIFGNPVLDMTWVALASMLLFFFPGVNVFEWDDFAKSISWDAIFTVGGVMALSSAAISTGLGESLANYFLNGSEITLHPALLLVIVCLVINFIHLILPVSPAIVTIALPPLLTLAKECGLNPFVMTMAAPLMAGTVMLLPIDAMPILTYNTKYYSLGDMLRSGLILSCAWSVVIGLWLYCCSTIFL
ncbi:MAG: anion permease [Clostridiales bacterium]|jgi:sodium-dependent dicarboxylate transporter 2/3/5|nr:anion permease [Clostridiales bacterium]